MELRRRQAKASKYPSKAAVAALALFGGKAGSP